MTASDFCGTRFAGTHFLFAKISVGLLHCSKTSCCWRDRGRGFASLQCSGCLYYDVNLTSAYVNSWPFDKGGSSGGGAEVHGGNTQPFSFAPSSKIILSRVLS